MSFAVALLSRCALIRDGPAAFALFALQESMLAGADEGLTELAFQYGRNVGLAFQLVDDLLDFVASSSALGKPAAADLKLGLATAPVLFACEKVGSGVRVLGL